MQQIIRKHKNRYKIQEILCTSKKLVLPTYNAHPYFSLKNLDKEHARYTWQSTVFGDTVIGESDGSRVTIVQSDLHSSFRRANFILDENNRIESTAIHPKKEV